MDGFVAIKIAGEVAHHHLAVLIFELDARYGRRVRDHLLVDLWRVSFGGLLLLRQAPERFTDHAAEAERGTSGEKTSACETAVHAFFILYAVNRGFDVIPLVGHSARDYSRVTTPAPYRKCTILNVGADM